MLSFLSLLNPHLSDIRIACADQSYLGSHLVARLDGAESWFHQWPLDVVLACLDDGSHSQSPVGGDAGLLVARVSVPRGLEVGVVDANGHVSPVYRFRD